MTGKKIKEERQGQEGRMERAIKEEAWFQNWVPNSF